ncbi:head GIN domain-containing protein [Rudanella lutea]|uniref:head GIN domain-containing protein n=1 Tax=Rudanella lutea TaxID=451374 RepID=UPI000373F980|nr:head GIN domain-containing protein [Rudanella lutea]
MKRNTFFLLALTLLTGLTMGFARAADDVRTFTLSGFDKVDIGSAFTIQVTQGSQFSVKASGRDEDLKELEATVTGGTLKVRYKKSNWGWNNNRKNIRIDVVMPQLRGMNFSGASTATVRGFRNQGDVKLDVSGASTANIDLDADGLQVDFSGASSVTLNGRATRMTGDVSGATTLRAYELKTKQVNLDVSGASNANVSATEKVNVEASGASSVRYRGGASVSSNTSGASSVRRDS